MNMIAKMYVQSSKPVMNGEIKVGEELEMSCVTDKPFDQGGDSEDNSFAKWSPSGSFKIMTTNPNLWGKFIVGEKYYLNFTKA